MGYDGKRGPINELLNGPEADGQGQDRVTEILHEPPGGTLHAGHFANECGQAWTVSGGGGTGRLRLERLATTSTLSLMQDEMCHLHLDGWQFKDLMGMVRRRLQEVRVATGTRRWQDDLHLGGFKQCGAGSFIT
jgi:hypothetical protein